MIQVLNGGQLTTTASQEDIIPMEINEEGTAVRAGRNIFCFELVSGSVQMGVGADIDQGDFVHAAHATAGEKWLHTASPEPDGGNTNIKAKGVAVSKIYW